MYLGNVMVVAIITFTVCYKGMKNFDILENLFCHY